MFVLKNKLKYLIYIICVLVIIFPFFSYAFDDTTFVWSEISSPTIETVASLNQDKR